MKSESKLITKFRKKLGNEGRNFRWFLYNYLPDMKYHTFGSQINSYNPMSEKLEKAIKKYLEEK